MKCNNCNNIVSYKKAPQLTDCVICGTPLVPDVTDVLDHGKFEVTKEKRPSQLALARDIEDLLASTGGTLLAEGGTGIGKSFAYLIPILLELRSRVVISTAKKSLQAQLVEKDLPYLLKKMKMSSSVSYTLYKGKSNYACWKLITEVPQKDKDQFKQLIQVAQNNSKPADLSDWPGAKPEWWDKTSIENCTLNTSCPHYRHCRPQPRESNLIITNHHLTAIDIFKAPGMLFGPYGILVLDEAHQVGNAFRSAHSKHLNLKGLEILTNMILNDTYLSTTIDESGIISAEVLTAQIANLKTHFTQLYTKAKKCTDNTGTIKTDKIVKDLEEFRAETLEISAKVFQVQESISRTRTESAFLHTNSQQPAVTPPEREIPERLVAMLSRVQRIHRRIDGLLEFVNFALYDTEVNVPSRTAQPTTIPNYITTLDDKGLTVQPLNLGTLVGPRLREIKHKVLISATLSVNKNFSYIRNLYGLESGDKTVERIYATPFDLKNQAIMYLPTHMPLPKHDGDVNRTEWISAVSTEIAQLVGATNGGAFVLFSAKSDMLDVAKELEPVWDSLGLDLIVQEGDTTATGREFTSGDNKVLFGLKSFWEGIDIPGDKLRLVIIPKLPFPSSSDPVIAALKKAAGDNSFYEVLIPLMFFDMKQGVGRLIRTQADKGFIAILDPRVWTGSINPTTHATRLKTIKLDPNKTRIGYGKDLLNFLGFNSITDDFTVVKKFVNKFFNKG